MNQSLPFLPAFNAPRVERYFCNDAEAIKEMFKVTSDNLCHDLNRLNSAFQENDITGIQTVIHTIMPIFNIIGLPAVEKEINNFHHLCMQADSAKGLTIAFCVLWPKLEGARVLIDKQCSLFEAQPVL
jgi:hypothetical protein